MKFMRDAEPPEANQAQSITSLLRSWRDGDQLAGERIMDALYPELRRLAAFCMKSEDPGHTLQPTALVHELYLKLLSGASVEWQDRAHFFAFAARKLRHILVDHARRARAGKRVAQEIKIAVEPESRWSGANEADIVALDQALQRLEEIDQRSCRALELRLFAGLTETEAAEVLGVSPPTVRRDVTFARAWLTSQLNP